MYLALSRYPVTYQHFVYNSIISPILYTPQPPNYNTVLDITLISFGQQMDIRTDFPIYFCILLDTSSFGKLTWKLAWTQTIVLY